MQDIVLINEFNFSKVFTASNGYFWIITQIIFWTTAQERMYKYRSSEKPQSLSFHIFFLIWKLELQRRDILNPLDSPLQQLALGQA